MGLRKGIAYRNVVRPYTRKSKFKKKGYIKSIPPLKIVKFDIGNVNKDFESQINLVSKERVQIRQNALESARVVINRRLHKLIGSNAFHLKLRIYPHHILRENKMLTGAGADRMQSGMQRAFGRPIGIAAQVKTDQLIFTVYTDKKNLDAAKEALRLAFSRLPCKCSIV